MSQTSDPVVIAALARTPMGGFQGVLSGARATDLGAAAVRAAVERAGVDPGAVEQIYMGCVLPGGLGQAPAEFATAPGPAMRRALERAGWTAGQVDLFEVNEAFAVVAMLAARELDIPDEKLNVNGGACALGHPIGASGARVLTTLVHGLRRQGKKYGLATLCIGGGEASAVIVEMV